MSAAVKAAATALRQFGPYAAIELLLPGGLWARLSCEAHDLLAFVETVPSGSLVAILLWLYRRHRARSV